MPAVSKKRPPARVWPQCNVTIPTRLPRWPSDWLGLSPEASHTARVAGSHRTNGFVFSNTVELSGMVETDWSPHTFTMNWRFTRPGRVRFEAGEPFCHLFPLQRQLIEQVQPQWKPLSEAPQLAQQHADWTHSRTRFLDELPDAQSAAAREKWQRGYFLGVTAPGQRSIARACGCRCLPVPAATTRPPTEWVSAASDLPCRMYPMGRPVCEAPARAPRAPPHLPAALSMAR